MSKAFVQPIIFLFLFITGLVCTSFTADTRDDRVPAPDFTLQDNEGKKVSLSDFKGKVVYIDFWATWCKSCIVEMPHSKALKEKYAGNSNVVFMYISIDNDDNIENWKAFIKKKGMTGVQLISREGQEEKMISRYGVQYIPHFILIDKKGNIASAHAPLPSDSMAQQSINQLLSE
jgi:peroxiredoxin